jgi:hypothetical protein
MAARAIWSGAITFGLVNVPIRMYSAIDEKDLRFNLLHVKDGSRIGYEKICKEEGVAVPDGEISTAYEVSKGEFVYLDDDDFARAAGPLGRTIDLADFVPYSEIDPIYFERTYYLGPADGAEKVYALLMTAMRNAGLAGIATYVMRKKQHLGCLPVDCTPDRGQQTAPNGLPGDVVPERQLTAVVSENIGLNELVDRVDQLREGHIGHRGQVVNAKSAPEPRRERRSPFRCRRHARQAPTHAVTHPVGQSVLDEPRAS